jgi:hypothetical protein
MWLRLSEGDRKADQDGNISNACNSEKHMIAPAIELQQQH